MKLKDWLEENKGRYEWDLYSKCWSHYIEINKDNTSGWIIENRKTGTLKYEGLIGNGWVDLTWVGNIFDITEEEKFILQQNIEQWESLYNFLRSEGPIQVYLGEASAKEISLVRRGKGDTE